MSFVPASRGRMRHRTGGRTASRSGFALRAAAVVAAAALLAFPAARARAEAPPEPVRALSLEVPNILAEFENLVARERMTQVLFDAVANRPSRRRVLVSDYQIAPLEEDPNVLWEFRFVREVDGKPVAGADQQMQDFLRLRHRDSREERLRITNLGLAKSLPGCYWHNLALILRAFEGPNVENFDWAARGENSWRFEQVRGLGIPQDLFDPRSARHYPHGSISFAGGALSRLDLEWSADRFVTSVSLEFTPRQPPADLPRPLRFVAKRRLTSSQRALIQTTYDYDDYRRFSVQSESQTNPASHP